ncbi:unnamed protein product, partial [Meganyctiphanes norvegica]
MCSIADSVHNLCQISRKRQKCQLFDQLSRFDQLYRHHKAAYIVAARGSSHPWAGFYNPPPPPIVLQGRSVRLTPSTILYSSALTEGPSNRSAQYLQKELPVRIAKRIMAFRDLPFIVGCNPTILGVHELYIRAFNILNSLPPIETDDDDRNYCQKLVVLLDDHKPYTSYLFEDFAKAFDKFDHEILLEKVLDHGISGKLGNWLKEYLKNRKFRVVANGSMAMIYELENIQRTFTSRINGMEGLDYHERLKKLKMACRANTGFPRSELDRHLVKPVPGHSVFMANAQFLSDFKFLLTHSIYICKLPKNHVDVVLHECCSVGTIYYHILPRSLRISSCHTRDEGGGKIKFDARRTVNKLLGDISPKS